MYRSGVGEEEELSAACASGARQVTIAFGSSHATSVQLDRIAGLYVSDPGGTLVATSGRDMTLTAASGIFQMNLFLLKAIFGILFFTTVIVSIVLGIWSVFKYAAIKGDSGFKKISRELLGPLSFFIPGVENALAKKYAILGYLCFGTGMGSGLLLLWLFQDRS